MKWSAIDLANNTVTIRHTVVGSGALQVKADKTKNKSSHRTLPLLDGLKTYLVEWKKKQDQNRAIFGKSYVEQDYICVKEDGSLVQPDNLTKTFYKEAEKAGLPRIRFHDLRHSAASIMIAEGFGLKEVSEFLGHSDIGITADTYGHLQYKAKVKLGNRMDELLLKEQTREKM